MGRDTRGTPPAAAWRRATTAAPASPAAPFSRASGPAAPDPPPGPHLALPPVAGTVTVRTEAPAVRRAGPPDLAALVALEEACYDAPRRQPLHSLRRSLQSPHQSVWVVEDDAGLAAALLLRHHKRTWRIFGVHVRPDRQGKGLGRGLVLWAEEEARRAGKHRMKLEADAQDTRLLAWYEKQGYRRLRREEDYYTPGRAAWHMEKRLA